MSENIVVGIILVGYLTLAIWGFRIGSEQAKADIEAANHQRQR